MYYFLTDLIIPLFLIINLLNLYGFCYSYFLYSFKINHKIHNKQIKLDLPIFYPLIKKSILWQNLLIPNMILVKNNINLVSIYSFNFITVIQILLIFFIDDFYFYFYHKAMHKIPYLYTNIHFIHHKAKSPYPINYICAHPFEIIVGSIGTFLGIIFIGNVQSISILIYTFIKIIHELDIHSGLLTFFNISILGKSEDHEIHHTYLIGNYSSTFNYLDKIFGTYITNKFINKKL